MAVCEQLSEISIVDGSLAFEGSERREVEDSERREGKAVEAGER